MTRFSNIVLLPVVVIVGAAGYTIEVRRKRPNIMRNEPTEES